MYGLLYWSNATGAFGEGIRARQGQGLRQRLPRTAGLSFMGIRQSRMPLLA